MRYLMLMLVGVLAGCGGSSDSDNTEVNTAPVLTGQLTIPLSATTPGTVNFALLDAENDTLSVSYTNKPNWVEGTLSANQFQLTATPDFFKVGTHQFVVRVSDGSLHSDYTVTLNVSDDPSKWVEIATPKAEFIGQWAMDNGDDLHLYANDTGRYLAADGEVFDLTWFGTNGTIEISSKKVNCVTDCYEHFEAYVIAKDELKKRLVLESDDEAFSVTVIPHEEKPLVNGIYTLNHLAVDFINEIKDSTAEVYLPWKFSVSGGSSTGWSSVTTEIAAGSLLAKQNVDDLTFYFYNTNTGERVEIAFNVNFDHAEILPSATERLTLEYQFSFGLTDPSVNPDDFQGLEEALASTYIGHIELGYNEQLEVPEFAIDTPYFSGFRLKSDFAGYDFNFGGTEVEFSADGKGIARFSIPQAVDREEKVFDWTIDGKELVITLAQTDYRYRFIEHPTNGLSLINKDKLHYPFLQRDQQYPAESLIGSFMAETLLDYTPYYHNIFADHSASLYSDSIDREGYYSKYYTWQEEADGSVTFIFSNACADGATFAECSIDLEQRLANGEQVTVNYRNYLVLKQTEHDTVIQTTNDYRNLSYNSSFQSITRLINVPQE